MRETFLTTSQLASQLGLGVETVRKAVRAGILRPTVRIGSLGAMRFDLADAVEQLKPASTPARSVAVA